jgi:acetyltransferase-like isoleucine patch superfamily enzyme
MESQKTSAQIKTQRMKENIIFPLTRIVPSPIRTILLRSVLGKLGNTRIPRDTSFRYLTYNRHAWNIEIGNNLIIEEGVRIRVLYPNTGIRIGDKVHLDRMADIKAFGGDLIEIGDNVYIGPFSIVAGAKIKIGNDCLIASHVGVYGNNHGFKDPDKPIKKQGSTNQTLIIEEDCWIGTGAKVLDGITIQKGCVVGAGAVVTKDLPPYSIAVGIPAKVVGKRGG